MREATTKAMPVIVEEERQSRQGRPAGARRAGGLERLIGRDDAQKKLLSLTGCLGAHPQTLA
jgi:hypothetical protein